VQEDAGGTEDWRLCPSPDSPRKSVKSTAVVKYSSVQSYANFSLLQCNTDLNLPPSNWLSSSAESYGLQYVPSHSSGFSRYVCRLRACYSISLSCCPVCVCVFVCACVCTCMWCVFVYVGVCVSTQKKN